MFGYIYKIKDNLTNLEYIGKHKYSKFELDENYITSGVLINRKIDKHGIENFSISLVDSADTLDELNEKERYYIQQYNTLYPNGYNLTDGGDGISSPSDEIREKISQSKLGSTQSAETRKKRSEALKGMKHNEEWVRKIAIANKNQEPTELAKQKTSEKKKGSKWYTNGVDEHMFQSTDEIPQGYRIGRLKNCFPSSVGRKMSTEALEKMRTSKTGKVWFNNGSDEKMFRVDEEPFGYIRGRLHQ